MEARQRLLKKEIIESDDIGLDGMLETAKCKSQLAGIQLVLGTPESYIGAYKEERDELLRQLEGNDDEDLDEIL